MNRVKKDRQDNILFSFVIPVYNTRKYITECIESVNSQKYSNIEIVLVDDGSTDGSIELCQEIAKKIDNVIFITQKHQGLSAARNNGMKVINGDYILFLDSDDYIEKDYIEKLLTFIKKNESPDIILLDGVKIFPDGSEEILDPNLYLLNDRRFKSKLCAISAMSKFPASACTKALKRKFIIENNLFFDEKIIAAEDIDFMIRAMLKANRIEYFESKYYYYRQNRKGSITNKPTLEKTNSYFSIIDDFCTKKNDLIKGNEEFVFSIISYQYSILLAQINFLSKAERSKLNYDYKKYKWILKYGKSKKMKAIYVISKLIGITFTSKILYLYLKARNKLHKGE